MPRSRFWGCASDGGHHPTKTSQIMRPCSGIQGTSTRVPSPSPSCSSTTTSWTIRTSDENRPRFWRGVVVAEVEVVRPWSPAVVRHCPARGSELGPVGTPGDAPGCRWMTMPSG
uniref:(northern house mosquito) hypothetical protein n=1 Tax=Culex pipiens TaxID=7175 RepID=A0A8D8CPZ3_CULPI